MQRNWISVLLLGSLKSTYRIESGWKQLDTIKEYTNEVRFLKDAAIVLFYFKNEAHYAAAV